VKLFRYAAPATFYPLAGRLQPVFAGLAVLLALGGLWLGFFVAPTDAQQGEGYRIIFVHVPAAWMAMFLYCVMAFWAAIGLAFRVRLSAMLASAIAPTGAMFAFLSLLTGSLWGKPMWGTWWVWDARLTSVLVLFLIYLGILAIFNAIEDQGQAGRIAAIATLVGFVNIPIVKFSVDWWNTLHQGSSVFTLDGPKIDPQILLPLLVMAIGFTLLFVALHLAAMRNEILRRRLRRLAILAAADAAPPIAIVPAKRGASA